MSTGMSATAVVYGDTLDVSDTKPISMSTLLKVELRKMLDTRAGKWLIITIVTITVLLVGGFLIFGHTKDMTFTNFMGAAATPQGLLLPVLGILLITQEWGQRTGMVTFTLVPHRGQVLWAKVFAAVLFGIAAVLIALGVAALATSIGGAPDAWHGVTAGVLSRYVLLEVVGIVGGLVFGLIFINTAAAIVVSFALPIAFSILTTVIPWLQKPQPWIDPSTAQGPLQSGDHLSGHDWGHLLTTTIIWVALPFVVGMWRMLRAEVK